MSFEYWVAIFIERAGLIKFQVVDGSMDGRVDKWMNRQMDG